MPQDLSSLLSTITKDGMDRAIQEGRIVWNAPLGYCHIKSRNGQTSIVPDENAPLIVKAFLLADEGQSYRQILRYLIDAGLTGKRGEPISIGTLHRILHNPFYVGKIVYNGEVREGAHDPLVSEELFRQVQIELGKRTIRGD